MNYKTISVAVDDKGKKHKAQGWTRVVHATHHPAWDAKNRHGLPDEFPMDYAYISHIFNGAPQASPVAHVEPVAPIVQQTPPVTPAPPVHVQQPVPPVTVPPQQQVQQVPAQPVANLDPGIPKALHDLMVQHSVERS